MWSFRRYRRAALGTTLRGRWPADRYDHRPIKQSQEACATPKRCQAKTSDAFNEAGCVFAIAGYASWCVAHRTAHSVYEVNRVTAVRVLRESRRTLTAYHRYARVNAPHVLLG